MHLHALRYAHTKACSCDDDASSTRAATCRNYSSHDNRLCCRAPCIAASSLRIAYTSADTPQRNA